MKVFLSIKGGRDGGRVVVWGGGYVEVGEGKLIGNLVNEIMC